MGERKKPLTEEEKRKALEECAEQFSTAMAAVVAILERERTKPKKRVTRQLPPEKQKELEECARQFRDSMVQVFKILERASQRSEVKGY